VASSLLQAQIFMLDFQGARWLNEGQVPGQAGNNHPTSIPTGVFKTKDGHINIATAGGTTWQRLCKAIGAEALLEHPDYATAAARSKNRNALNVEIERYLATGTSAEWVERMSVAEVPCGPIYAMDEVFADPQVEHLGVVGHVETSDKRGTLHLLNQPVSLSRTPSRLVGAPPERGEHTEEVLREFGFSEADIASCARQGDLASDPEYAVTTTDKMLARKDGRVGTMIFNNPERHNAVSLDMWQAASRILDDFARDDEVRVVVLTGAGGKAFVSGADISKFADERSTREAVEKYGVAVERFYSTVYAFPKPTIAAIQGYCIGGGLGLAVTCDLRFCTQGSRFALPAAKLGLGYGFNGLERFINTIGPTHTKDIFFSAASSARMRR
jgi:hypothetical protein